MMASNNSIQQSQSHHFQPQPNTTTHHCKECGLKFNSAESLEVHFNYHKENLLNKWATQAAASGHSDETNNNNNTSKPATIKREFIPNTVSAAADSSDAMLKKSPDYGSRATPESSNNFGHPPTPQSYQSASSPYQNPDHSGFSPSFQSYQSVKERTTPPGHYQQHYQNYPPENQYYNMDSQQQQQPQQSYPDFNILKMQPQSSFRYHPYQQQQQQQQPQQQQNSYDPSNQAQSQVSSSSPAFPPQPTPSPSPKQCDKCGYVCESAAQLVEHNNLAHPTTPSYAQNHFLYGNQTEIKTEEDAQSEILDLDSHKVHQVYQEEEKRQNGELPDHHPHSVSAMLSAWPHQQHNKFQEQQRMFMNGPPPDQKIYPNGMMGGHQMHPADYVANGVTTSSQEVGASAGVVGPQQTYRPFDHLAPQSGPPVITSTQVPNAPTPASGPVSSKGANWKSNEARRPKTYNCTACNKWFTSSGHLKRHYNTTLHKNAVKSSGQPDPATMPISAHHHPGRDNVAGRSDDSSPGPDDSRSEDSQNNYDRASGLLQQPPSGPYDRQPTPTIMHNTSLHSPMGHNGGAPLPHPTNHLANISGGSPPNGEAGPSATSNIDTRGLLTLPTTPTSSPFTSPGFNMAHMMPMDTNQFQMYPNGSAPHVMQVMVTSSPNTTGELMVQSPDPQQPLPSFAQIQAHRYGLLMGYGGGNANVGGMGPATAPYTTYYTEAFDFPIENTQPRPVALFRQEEGTFHITALHTPEEQILPDPSPYSPPHAILTNNNINNNHLSELHMPIEAIKVEINDLKVKFETQPASPEKAHIKRDFEESTGSPLITSTVPAIINNNNNNNIKQNGVHKCYDCDKMFNKACYLTQHNKTFHSGDRPYKCSRCGKRFSCELQYHEHLPKHAGDKPYKCDLCPKQFNHKTDLRRHMCLHTGQKPYACDTCGKGFIRKDHMLKHCETHTRKTNHVSKLTAVR